MEPEATGASSGRNPHTRAPQQKQLLYKGVSTKKPTAEVLPDRQGLRTVPRVKLDVAVGTTFPDTLGTAWTVAPAPELQGSPVTSRTTAERSRAGLV
jgi:hypothetical protein